MASRPGLRANARKRLLLAVLVVTWAASWPLVKLGLRSVPPLWYGFLRYGVATACLFFIAAARRELTVPRGPDWCLVAVSGLLQMAAYSALTASALTVLPPGRASVLAYSTPIWVVPLSAVYLRELPSRASLLGVALGMGGVVAIARPSLHASDQRQLLAYGLLLLAAGAWATSIVYVRAHRFGASPLALAPWQALVAATALLAVACLSEGAAPALTTGAVVSLSFVGPVATAFAYWAVIDVGRVLRPSTISMALLGTPALGVLFSALTLGETVGPSLLGGLVLIGTGIGVATVHGEPRLRSSAPKAGEH